MVKSGTVIWITGLSGTGKTTIAKTLQKRLKTIGRKIILIDGDNIRKVLGNSTGHKLQERKKLALIYSRLCKMLADQGFDVVCATISLFHDCHNWNRKYIKNYREILLKVPVKTLFKRDPKKIYRKVGLGKITNVVGIDIKPEMPLNPDITIINDGHKTPKEISEIIAGLL